MQEKAKEPEIRFAGFTGAWEQRKFGEMANRRSEVSASGNLPRVEYEDIVSGTGTLNKDVFEKQSQKQGIVFHSGDVLYGKLRPYLQNWLLASFNGLAVGDFWVLEPQGLNSNYLYRIIQTKQFDEIANQSVGTKMPRADWKLVSKATFLNPASFNEQRLIGKFFKDIDSLLTLHQRKYEKLLNIKKSMLEKMFPKEGEVVPEIRFKGFTGAWEQRKAKDVLAAYSDKGHPGLDVLSATQDRGMVRRDDNNINISHDKKNEATYKRVLPGQFVIHLRSFQGGFAYSSIEGITSPAYTVFGFSKPQEHEPNFWKFVFSSEQFIKRLEKVTYGIRDGRSISYDEVLTLSFTFPGKEEQIQIAHFLDKVGALITLHQRKLEMLKNVKQAFLEKMFV